MHNTVPRYGECSLKVAIIVVFSFSCSCCYYYYFTDFIIREKNICSHWPSVSDFWNISYEQLNELIFRIELLDMTISLWEWWPKAKIFLSYNYYWHILPSLIHDSLYIESSLSHHMFLCYLMIFFIFCGYWFCCLASYISSLCYICLYNFNIWSVVST